MCFSATANFTRAAVIGTVGIATLREVRHRKALTANIPVAGLYVIATCGALLFSGFRYLILFGIANFLGLVVVWIVMAYAFTSIWCAYAGLMSMIIYFHFRRRKHMPPVLHPLRA